MNFSKFVIREVRVIEVLGRGRGFFKSGLERRGIFSSSEILEKEIANRTWFGRWRKIILKKYATS